MKISISDVHDSHGDVFTLTLNSNRRFEDRNVMSFLRDKFMATHRGIYYIYEIAMRKNTCQLGFSEGQQYMAKVDNRWNHRRRDRKYPVMILEDKLDSIEDKILTPYETCYWCRRNIPSMGTIDVDYVEIMVKEGNNFVKKSFNVHNQCQLLREKQMALIPFPLFAMEGTTP